MKAASFKVKGMQKDLSESSFNPQFAYDIKNMRIMTTDDNTLMSLVNEKGPKELIIKWDNDVDTVETPTRLFAGTPIGQTIIGKYYILFTTGNVIEDDGEVKRDFIYKFWFEGDDFIGRCLYYGNLKFNTNNPIETLVYYENEGIQKVYWVDGINQTRMINIAADTIAGVFDRTVIDTWNEGSFDFIVNLSLNETVSVTKNISNNGLFAAGVIQYAFTYFNRFGLESNIFDITSLQYLSFIDRGGSPEEAVSNSFTIQVSNIDTSFDFIRIYSIFRTSINSTPVVKKLIDIETNDDNSITYIDNGSYGDIIDPTILYYIGGEKVVANSINQKDNTLFLGNLKIERLKLPDSVKSTFRDSDLITYTNKSIIYQPSPSGTYPYTNTLMYSSEKITTLKQRETYRHGVIFLHESGKWSEVVYVGDKTNNVSIISGGNLNTALVGATINLNNSTELTNLINAGYVKARPVIVYPTITDRTVLCQGFVNPTVYNVENRLTNSPFAQASWFTRPIINKQIDSTGMTDNNQNVEKGSWLEFRHNYLIPSSYKRNGEIQNIDTEVTPYINTLENSNWSLANKHMYYVDNSIVTLHSPDIEFDDELKLISMTNIKFRIVGMIPITGTQMGIDVQTSTAPIIGSSTPLYRGFTGTINVDIHGFKGMNSGAIWHDKIYNPDTTHKNTVAGFVVYPWHRSGSLTNASNPEEGTTLPALLDKKKMSNLRFSTFTNYSILWYPINDNSTPVIFNSKDVDLSKITKPLNSVDIGNLFYYGNMDSISFKNEPYSIIATVDDATTSADYKFKDIYKKILYTSTNTATDPVRIKYKSSPHAVIAFNYTSDHKQVILPSFNDMNKGTLIYVGARPFWKNYTGGAIDITNMTEVVNLEANYYLDAYFLSSFGQEFILYKLTGWNIELWEASIVEVGVDNAFTESSLFYLKAEDGVVSSYYEVSRISGNHIYLVDKVYPVDSDVQQTDIELPNGVSATGFLYMGELYRSSVSNRFGGTSDSALLNNTWVPSGPSVKLNSTSVTLTCNQGDTYFLRYDHLKTYPFNNDDVNSVVDIVSFMVETRVNIDGRYDKNRASSNNLTVNPNNFNLLNPIYDQKDNFFVYRPLNTILFTEDSFPNSITWTLSKSSASLIDAWTSISLASIIDLDGDKGPINSIKRLNNELIVFQDKGISNILFNSRTLIAATDGVPIEIANSGKVEGKRYLSDKTGCLNKWSIVESPMGLYFIDDINKAIILYDGKINNISDDLGFHSWINEKSVNINIWDPENFKLFIGYYDKVNGDVFFISNEECLAFSEPLKTFSSFYSYENVPYFMNILDKGIWVNKTRSLDENASKEYSLWEHNKGEYNRFFDKSEDFYITLIVNPEPTLDKVFDIVEFRMDSFDNTNTYLPTDSFDKLTVWNEYQHGVNLLSNAKNRPSTLKKKFRMWRANIPRDGVNKRDRMRNPWIYLTLSKQGTLCHHKTILHDINIWYNTM